MIINKIFAPINNGLYKLTGKLPDPVRWGALFICSLLLEAIYFFDLGYSEDAQKVMLYGSALTLLIAVFSIDSEAKPVSLNRWTSIPLGLFAIGVIVISFLHPVGDGYVFFAADILLLFPFLHFVLISGNGAKRLNRVIALSTAAEGVLSYLYCAWLSFHGELKIGGTRIMGHTTNPNFLGALGLIMLMAGLYLLLDGSNTAADILAAASVGGGVYFMIGAVCRTALLSTTGCILVMLVFVIKRKVHGQGQKKSLARIAVILAVAVVVFGFGMKLNDISFSHMEKSGTEAVQQGDSEEAVDETEALQHRITPDDNVDSFSSGRVALWKLYIDNFSMTGKDLAVLKEQDPDRVEWRAHNNFIDYIFRFGYIVGSFYALFYIAAGVLGLGVLFSKNRCTEEDFLLVECIGCYALYAVIEIATLPFMRCVPCLFFILTAPVMMKRVENKEVN